MPKSGDEKKGEGLCPCSEILHRDSATSPTTNLLLSKHECCDGLKEKAWAAF